MKKNKKSWNLLCLTLVMALFASSLLVACDDTTVTPPTQPVAKTTVTVLNGTGGGEFEKNSECSVTATIPDDQAFSRWEVGGKEVSRDNPYTFVVGEDDITVSAVTGTPYKLVVEGGKIGATTEMESDVIGEEKVSITAKSTSAKTFLYWIVNNGTTQIKDNPYTVTIKGDTFVKAIYDEVCLISVADGMVSLDSAPEASSKSMRIKMGDACTIKANEAPSGQKFSHWYYIDENRKEVKLSSDTSYSFVVASSRKIYAKYDFYYVVTVVGGYINDNAELNTSDIWADTDVTITAITPSGKGFAGWQIGTEIVSKDAVYKFRVTSNTNITAIFADHIKLTAPQNNDNQMFKYVGYGDNRNTTEFDRQKDENGGRKTAFVEGVDYILYHVYASRTEAPIATFKLVKGANSAGKVTTMDGTKSIGCGNNPGDYYIDNTSKKTFYEFFAAVIGENYSKTQSYFFAAQVIGVEGSIYKDSDISAVGTSSIKEGE